MDNIQSNPFSHADYWDHVSSGYDDVARWVMKPFSFKAAELVGIKEHHLVIDVACGTGTLSLPIASKVQAIKAIDFSPNMISRLNETIAVKKIQNVQAQVGDGQNLDYTDGQFDAAFSMFGLMFFPDRAKGFSEIYRVLKPNGKAAISGWAPIEKSTLMSVLSDAFKFAYPEAPSPRKNSMSLEDPVLFEKEMKAAAFKDVVIHEVKNSVSAIPPKPFWEIMSSGGPLSLFKKKVGQEEWERISKKALSYLEDELGENGRETYTTAYIGVGTR